MDRMKEWTNEEHMKFLNSIEASFVRAMFSNNASSANINEQHKQEEDYSSSFPSHKNCLLRLNRLLPDSCDSTEDLPTQRRRSHSTSTQADNMVDNNNRSTVKAERKTRRVSRSHQPYASLQDQVVPEGELRRRE